MEANTPRTNAPLLSQHMGHTVILIGRVSSSSPQNNTIALDSAGIVNIILPHNSPQYQPGTAVQVIGRVGPDLSIKALLLVDLGTQACTLAVIGIGNDGVVCSELTSLCNRYGCIPHFS